MTQEQFDQLHNAATNGLFCQQKNAEAQLYTTMQKVANKIVRIKNARLSTDETKDIVQDCLLNLLSAKGLANYKPGNNWKAWVSTCMRNKLKDALRSAKRKNTLSLDDGFESEDGSMFNLQLADCSFDELSAKQRKIEQLKTMWSYVRMLPENFRAVLLLQYNMNLSQRETARYLKTTEENVGAMTCRAKVQLKKMINGTGGDSPVSLFNIAA
jgi:RNA polymerase sigma factor (sigma-70 family)